MLCAWHHLAPLSSSHGSPIPRPPYHSEEIRGEIDTRYTMYKCSMACSCDPTLLIFFGPIRSPSKFGRCLEVVEPQCYFQPRTRVPKKVCLAFNTNLDGPSLAFSNQPWMTSASQSMKGEKGCVKQMIRCTVELDNWLLDACKVRRSRPAGFSPRAG